MALSRDEATINEQTNPTYCTQLYKTLNCEEKKSKLLLSEIQSLTLSYYNAADGAIINSRTAQNVLNANQVTVEATGKLKWGLTTDDTAIQDSTLDAGVLERHIALFTVTTVPALGSRVYRHQVTFFIKQLTKV